MPGQNTPASTTMATIEQGLKVFTSIYKRIFRSLSKEFQKLYKLNAMYLNTNPSKFAYDRDGVVVSGTISKELYQKAKLKIVPSSDPNMVSETQKLILQSGLQELVPLGHINTEEMTKRSLEMQGQPGISKLMSIQPPGPPPDFQVKMRQLDIEEKKNKTDAMFKAEELQSQSLERLSKVYLNLAQAEAAGQTASVNLLMTQVEALGKEEERHRARVQMALDFANANADRAQAAQQQEAQQNAGTNQGAVGGVA